SLTVTGNARPLAPTKAWQPSATAYLEFRQQ
ncbi:MAG: hypothetical protein QOI39_481, partial [Mycobacterium sp.]|nr:hypothetical protein [Mycobacterium sp.]